MMILRGGEEKVEGCQIRRLKIMTNVGEGGIKFFLPGRRGILWGGDGVLGGGGREGIDFEGGSEVEERRKRLGKEGRYIGRDKQKH